jgi:proline iminopeptidase
MVYPVSEPFRRGRLEREPGHSLYFEECGRTDGIPVVVLHGGPGSGCRPEQRRLFDPRAYRVILPDQRGSGHSRPFGSLADNRTPALVEDLEALRRHLGIERWVVCGGSWGGTLALCYAERHPARVLGMILRGTLAGRRRDRDWVFGADGIARCFPEAYARFRSVLPSDLWHDPLAGYGALLDDQIAATRRTAASAWLAWERHVATAGRVKAGDAGRGDSVERARIACHYAANDFFLHPRDGALPAAGALDGIPGTIVHGRRDLMCPVEQAFAVHERWPDAELEVIEEAGHLAGEPAITAALVAAADRLRDELEH